MATLISANGGGNWTTLATWRNACSGSGASLLTLTAAESKTNTTYTYGVAFTVTNAEVVEGFALHLQRSGTTGTLAVALSDDNGTTATREVTVNLSDLPSAYSWVFFKFGSTLTADGGADYKVGIKLSVGSSGVSIYRGSATTGDWSHLLREDSAPGSLAAGDVFYIMDALTGTGAKTANTVTMDNTDTTDFNAVTVGFGTLTYGGTAATNYYLKVSGDVAVWGGGTLNIGTTGTPMPATSTAMLEFDPTSDGEFGLIVKDGGTLVAQGNPMTKVWTLLNANASANATSLTTADSTGWKDNDQIAIASTTRTYTQCEIGAVNGDASGTALTVDGFGGTAGGLAYAHDGSATGGPGNADIRAEIVNLTRNVKIRSATSTIMTYIYVAPTATVDFDYVEMYYLGENVTNKRGLEIATTFGSCSIQYCSLHNFEDGGCYIYTASGSVTFSNNVAWSLSQAALSSLTVAATTGAHTIMNNVFVGCFCGANVGIISLSHISGVFTNNIVAGCYDGGGAPRIVAVIGSGLVGTFDGLTVHSCSGGSTALTAIVITGLFTGTLNNLKSWRNNGNGISTSVSGGQSTVSNMTVFGNLTNAVATSPNGASHITYKNLLANGESGYATSTGLQVTLNATVRLINSSLGTSVAHTGSDVTTSLNSEGMIYAYNSVLGSSTPVSIHSSSSIMSFVRSQKTGASATAHNNWYKNGTIHSDQTIRHTATGFSWRIQPTASSVVQKMILPGPTSFDTFKVAVVASAAVTITAWVHKNATYNGNAPRLVLVGGYLGGIAADVVDSLSVGADTWEQLSVSGTPNEAGVIEWYIDCDGTAGSVYVDDMAVAQSGLPSADNLDYVSWGLPLLSPYTFGAAAAGGLLTHPGMSGGMRG